MQAGLIHGEAFFFSVSRDRVAARTPACLPRWRQTDYQLSSVHLTGDVGPPSHWMQAPPGALAKAPVVATVVAIASNTKRRVDLSARSGCDRHHELNASL
jgi:hypothetical protein